MKCACCDDDVGKDKELHWYRLCRDCFNEVVLGVIPPAIRVYVRGFGGRSDPSCRSEMNYDGDTFNATGFR